MGLRTVAYDASGNIVQGLAERDAVRYRVFDSNNNIINEFQTGNLRPEQIARPTSNDAQCAVSDVVSGPIHQTLFTFTDLIVPVTDEAAVVGYGGKKFATMPQGIIKFMLAVLNLTRIEVVSGVNADADGDLGIGLVTASNNATLASTEQTIIPTNPIPQLASSVGSLTAYNTADIVPQNGATTPLPLWLNVLWDDADQGGGGSVKYTGTFLLSWLHGGDF